MNQPVAIILHVFGTQAALEGWLYGQVSLAPSVKVIKNQSMFMIEMADGAVRMYCMVVSGREAMYHKMRGIEPTAIFEHDSFNDGGRRADRIPWPEWSAFTKTILRR